MALTRQKKAEKVDRAGNRAGELDQRHHRHLCQADRVAGLRAAQDVREAGGSYRVLKNKLAARAAKGTKIEAALQGLKGVSSVAYTRGDPGGAGQGHLDLGGGERRVHLQAGHRRRQGHQYRRDQAARHHAWQGTRSSRSCSSSSTLRRSGWLRSSPPPDAISPS